MRALPLGAKRERSRLLRRGGAFRKAWFSDAQRIIKKCRAFCHSKQNETPFCVILSGTAHRAAQSKDLYSNTDNIPIEIPRQARDDRE